MVNIGNLIYKLADWHILLVNQPVDSKLNGHLERNFWQKFNMQISSNTLYYTVTSTSGHTKTLINRYMHNWTFLSSVPKLMCGRDFL